MRTIITTKCPAANGRFGASGVHIVVQFAVFRRFSSRPSDSGNPACVKPLLRYRQGGQCGVDTTELCVT